ncbi:hypothetical protein MN032_13925 [Agromyces atrinae]|uniref:hypothetical protein n=1 Tax=Agromyces atrinae TaxID=592376 RepID=UPI001F5AB240|nr:hypothetical protein [Agromyces atrinae]MCI2958792.1 hypothetical protein [Agromyces atrinae]
MKRLPECAGILALLLTMAGCTTALTSYQERLEHSSMRDELRAATGPAVSDVKVSVVAGDDVLVRVILIVDPELFRADELCTVAAAALEAVPFATQRLAFGLYPPGNARYLETSDYFDELGVDSQHSQLGEAVLSWEDATAFAETCS